MLHQAYLSHLRRYPRSSLHRIPFDQALENRVIFLCLKNLAISARREQEARRGGERPPLELT